MQCTDAFFAKDGYIVPKLIVAIAINISAIRKLNFLLLFDFISNAPHHL